MFQNLNIRWGIIIAVIVGAIYFIMPTYELYSIKNDPDLSDIDTTYLQEDAIKLGLDLQGGLYIVLELDHQAYLLQNANQKLTFEKKEELSNLINSALSNAISNQTDAFEEFNNISNDESIQLIQYYSNSAAQ